MRANFEGKGKFYPGNIARLNADGTYIVAYDDGDRETNVPFDYIRREQPDTSEVQDLLSSIKSQNPGLLGDSASSNPDVMEAMRGLQNMAAEKLATAGGSPGGSLEGPSFDVGDPVEGNFQGEGRWYPGTIKAVNPDGSFAILYVDRAHPRLLRVRCTCSRPFCRSAGAKEQHPTYRS